MIHASPFFIMTERKLRAVAGLLLAALACILFMTAGCVQTASQGGNPSGEEYAFIDHHVYIDGTLINGTCPPLKIDLPTYRYDTESGSLEGLVRFDINESLTVIYGKGTSLSGDLGSGNSSILFGGYRLPCSFGNLTVNGFTGDGAVHLRYNNQTLVLLPGERWTDITAEQETTPLYSMKTTKTETITYYGILQKNHIHRNRNL